MGSLSQIFSNLSANTVHNAYKATVPSNVRLLIKSMTNPTPITENNFSPKELQIMKQTVSNANNRGGSYVGYEDYPRTKTIVPIEGDNTPIRSTLLSPSYAMATTVGKAQINNQPNGTHIIDNYNFGEIDPAAQEEFSKLSKVYQAAERTGNKFGKPMPVDINLGKVRN